MRNWLAWITAGVLALTAVIVIVAAVMNRGAEKITSEYLVGEQFEGLEESPKASWSLYSQPCSWESPSSSSIKDKVVDDALCADMTEEELWVRLKPGDKITVDDATSGIVIREAYKKKFVNRSSKREFKPRPISGPSGIAVDVLFHESGIKRALRVRTIPDADP